jgi:hypothetical protein
MNIPVLPGDATKMVARFFPWLDAKYFIPEKGAWVQGKDYGRCTNLNSALVRALEKQEWLCSLVGADCAAMEGHNPMWTTGHDWLLVFSLERNYLLDLWLPQYINLAEERLIYNLDDPEDKAAVDFYYPPRDRWTTVPLPYAWCDAADRDWQDFLKSFQS